MSTIRPNLPQPLPPSAKPASDARAAFFQAALAKTQAVAQVAARPQPPLAQPVRPAEPQAAPPPYRRPGSLLDIKV